MMGRRVGSYLGWAATLAIVAALLYGLVRGTFSSWGAPRFG